MENRTLKITVRMSFLRDDNDNTAMQLPVGLANALKQAMTADISAEGDSPPPSRPAPQHINGRRRRQFKSTENVNKGFNEPNQVKADTDKVYK